MDVVKKAVMGHNKMVAQVLGKVAEDLATEPSTDKALGVLRLTMRLRPAPEPAPPSEAYWAAAEAFSAAIQAATEHVDRCFVPAKVAGAFRRIKAQLDGTAVSVYGTTLTAIKAPRSLSWRLTDRRGELVGEPLTLDVLDNRGAHARGCEFTARSDGKRVTSIVLVVGRWVAVADSVDGEFKPWLVTRERGPRQMLLRWGDTVPGRDYARLGNVVITTIHTEAPETTASYESSGKGWLGQFTFSPEPARIVEAYGSTWLEYDAPVERVTVARLGYYQVELSGNIRSIILQQIPTSSPGGVKSY